LPADAAAALEPCERAAAGFADLFARDLSAAGVPPFGDTPTAIRRARRADLDACGLETVEG